MYMQVRSTARWLELEVVAVATDSLRARTMRTYELCASKEELLESQGRDGRQRETRAGSVDPASEGSRNIPGSRESGRGKRMLSKDRLSAEDYSACLGMAKAIHVLGKAESMGSCAVERSSVYGAALAIPQVARSAKWPKTMLCLTVRSYLFLALNYFVQALAVYYLYDSQTTTSYFGGQMHLCDFAAHIENCPDGPNCIGPGGKKIVNPGSLYSYDIWNTRKFVRDSLKVLFPEKSDLIDEKVDPGEYGVESYYCRLLCIFVFMVAIADEFQNILDLGKLLWNLPSRAEAWVQYSPPDWGAKEYVKQVHGHTELELVEFQVAGIARHWKLFYFVILFIPKVLLWRLLAMAGIHFLMETASMVDQIVNTTALSFVFTIDEMIMERLTTQATKHIMNNLKDYPLYDPMELEDHPDEAVMERYEENEMTWCFGSGDWWLFPRRLMWSVSLMWLFTTQYYLQNCDRAPDGSWVSKDVAYPKDSHLHPACWLLLQCEQRDNPFWTYASVTGQ